MPTYDYTFKVLLLGDRSAEKSVITKQYCYNIFDPAERLTIGVDFHVKTIEHQGRKIKLQIWDVGGEERFRFLLPTYCLGANAAFLLYDITRRPTLDNISEWVNIVRQKAGSIPIMLIGSKLDLAENYRQVSRDYGIQIAERNGFSGFAEVSARTGENINQIFEGMAEAVLTKMESNREQFIVIPESNVHLVMKCKCKVCGYKFVVQDARIVNRKYIKGVSCPHCQSSAIVKHSNTWVIWLLLLIFGPTIVMMVFMFILPLIG